MAVAVADLGEHLDVVPLVADGQHRTERHLEPASEPADCSALGDPRRDELDEVRVADRHVGKAGEPHARQRCDLGRERRLAVAHDLRDRVADRRDEVVLAVGRVTHERRVLVGERVVGADDEPLEMVDVRVEAMLARPDDDLACDRRRQRRVDEHPARAAADVAAGISRMSAALVADDRRDEVELPREAQRARHHPTGDERDDHAARTRPADRRSRVRPDHEVVADERPVDVEGDHGDGQDGLGRDDRGHDPDDDRPRPSSQAGAARAPTRLDPGDAWEPGEVHLDHARPARQRAHRRARDRLALVCPDLEQRDPAVASASGSRTSSRSMTASPSGPPSSASTGSNDVARGSVAMTSVRTYGRFASTTSNGTVSTSPPGSRSASANRDAIRDRVPDGVLARQTERIGRDVGGEDVDRLERPSASAAPPPARPRSRHSRSPRPRPGAAACPQVAPTDAEPAHDLGLGQLDQSLGLGARDRAPGRPSRRRARRTP